MAPKNTTQKLIIYYFSGTGNAFSVANWIYEIARNLQMDVQLINIAEFKNRKISKPAKNALIGFVSPTHGFNFPPVMFHFLLKFPVANGNRAFIINTRGGLKFKNLYLPGLSGMAQYFSALILLLKKYRIIGMRPIDLPSNWISIHPGLHEWAVESIYSRRRQQVISFAGSILGGARSYPALKDLVQDIIITPIAIGYYFFGRYLFAKSFIASEKCNNCLICVNECPVQAIKIISDRPFWTHHCESCMHCMNACPHRAIETAHGFILAIAILVNSFLIYQLYRMMDINLWLMELNPGPIAGVAVFLFENLFFFACLFIGYRLMHFLLRFTLIEKLVIYSSLTRYNFWKRYNPAKFRFWKAYNFKQK